MSRLIVIVTGISAPDPYNQVALSGSVQLEDTGPAGGYPWDAYAAASAAQNTVKGACITAAQAIAAAHSWTYSGSLLVGWPDEAAADDDSGLLAVPGASSTVSLSSGTARQPSTTRPVKVMVSGSWSWSLSAVGTVTGSLTLKSDSSSTPTTVVRAPPWSRGITVGVVVGDTGTMPVEFDYMIPPGHYYSVTSAGGATFSIREQVF